jgi:hypothetical protein
MPIHGQQAVVILGMHRSGTSAVAGTAVRLGFAPPLTPLPAAEDNPSGFYESLPVMEINHRLLKARNCTWNRCLGFEPAQINAMLTPSGHQCIADTIRQEFGHAAGFVLKDPRMCLTLPAWMPALREAGAAVSVLIVVRHPAEVIQSLARRDRLSEPESTEHWLHYMLEAERLSRGLPRAVLFYDELMRDWRRCMTRIAANAAIAWPKPVTRAGRDVDRFLAGSARHHNVAQTSARVGPRHLRTLVNSVWSMFRFLTGDPESPVARVCLDRAHAQFAPLRLAHVRPTVQAGPV